MKSVKKVTNADSVVVVQRPPLADRLVVDIRTIAAAHVLDEELVLDTKDAGMFAADSKVIGRKDDVAVRIAAEENAVFLDPNALLGIEPFQDDQMSPAAGLHRPASFNPLAVVRAVVPLADCLQAQREKGDPFGENS